MSLSHFETKHMTVAPTQLPRHLQNPHQNRIINSHIQHYPPPPPPLPEQPTPHSTAEQFADYRHKRKDDFMQQKKVVSERMKLQCVLIVGDSILKPLRPSTMSSQKRVKCKTLPGAKLDDLFEPTKNMVDKNLPQTVIIHVGSNNMAMNDSTTIKKSGVTGPSNPRWMLFRECDYD